MDGSGAEQWTKSLMENKLTIAELAKNIGKKAIWSAKNGLKFEVEIKNVEIFEGARKYSVAPVAGSGQARVRDALEIQP